MVQLFKKVLTDAMKLVLDHTVVSPRRFAPWKRILSKGKKFLSLTCLPLLYISQSRQGDFDGSLVKILIKTSKSNVLLLKVYIFILLWLILKISIVVFTLPLVTLHLYTNIGSDMRFLHFWHLVKFVSHECRIKCILQDVIKFQTLDLKDHCLNSHPTYSLNTLEFCFNSLLRTINKNDIIIND